LSFAKKPSAVASSTWYALLKVDMHGNEPDRIATPFGNSTLSVKLPLASAAAWIWSMIWSLALFPTRSPAAPAVLPTVATKAARTCVSVSFPLPDTRSSRLPRRLTLVPKGDVSPEIDGTSKLE
jgi:hypothetical protein